MGTERDQTPASARPEIINIAGELVALGPIRRELVPLYQRWINDFETTKNLLLPPGPMTFEAETEWFNRTATGSDVFFTIYETSTWRPIGIADLRQIDYRHRSASFGIMIGEASCRGKGYGTEVARLMLDYAFTGLGLHNVLLTVFEFNFAGRRSYEKAGFKEMGRRRQCRWLDGQWWDEIYMDCLATEFESPVLGKILIPDTRRPSA
ncbi:MAG: GNAT family N-acetyltransferase [Chloroflexota bacterium]|nr:GNAT family N-acetyltransferase [Chloroflexota bacterium]